MLTPSLFRGAETFLGESLANLQGLFDAAVVLKSLLPKKKKAEDDE